MMNSFALCHRLRFIKPYLLKSNVNVLNCRNVIFTKTNILLPRNSNSNDVSSIRKFPRTVCSTNIIKPDGKSNPSAACESKSILNNFTENSDSSNNSEKRLKYVKKSMDESNDTISSPYNSIKQVSHNFVDEQFKEFLDSDAAVMHSSEEMMSGSGVIEDTIFHIDQTKAIDLSEINAQRGISGVYDIDELVGFLHKENLSDIAVVSIHRSFHYAEFLVLATAKSPRHCKAVTERVLKLYKKKKLAKDPFITVEGENVSDWKVLDMGNIVLHIFLEETRMFYDIESVWLFDSEFDSGGLTKEDPVFDAIHEQMSFFNAVPDTLSTESKKDMT